MRASDRGVRLRRGALSLLIAAASLGALWAAAPAPASAAMQVGVQDDPVFVFQSYAPPGGRPTAFSDARAFGSRWIRVNVIWSDYVRHGFSAYDSAVNSARLRGLNVQMTVAGAPSYDSRGN